MLDKVEIQNDMNGKKPIVYFISKDDKIKNQFKESINLTEIVHFDPLYIINLDLLKENINISEIIDENNNIKFVYAVNDWIPLRFQCKLKSCEDCTLDKYYDKKDKKICILKQRKQVNLIQRDFRKLDIEDSKESDNLIYNLKRYLCNIVGMYFFGEPKDINNLVGHLGQIKRHYDKISLLNFDNSSNSFYKTAFNRVDYGISIVSSDDRTIIYTNRARRKHFGADIIGKKCFEVFVIKKGKSPCAGCPMGEVSYEVFPDRSINRNESHKLKDKHNSVYFISETASKLEIVDELRNPIDIYKFGINVVRDISAKTIAYEFQRIIQKLDSYHHIIRVLKFAIIGGTKKEFKKYYNDYIKENNKSLKEEFFNHFLNKVSYRDSNNNVDKIINFGFGRMRYYRNHINIFDKEFTKIEDPLQGDTLQIFTSFSNNIKQDNSIKGKYIDLKTAKENIINEIYYNPEKEKVDYKIRKKKSTEWSEKSKKFIENIGLKNTDQWYDIKLEAKDTPLGYIAVDFKGKEDEEPKKNTVISKNDSIHNEQYRYLLLLIDFAAQAIQRAIDHKELDITKEITGIINREYDNEKELYLNVSKILCERLETLKCEIFTKKSNLIFRDFIYYSTLTPKQNKELFKKLSKNTTIKPNVFSIGKNMLGNVLNIIGDNLDKSTSKEYEKCISVPNYDLYDAYYSNDKNKKVKNANKIIEEQEYNALNNNYFPLKNCVIAPLLHKDKILGAIKLTNNGKTGKLFFPYHEQRILYYVAQQLATKIENIKLIERERTIDNIFNHFSELQKDAEDFNIGILDDWHEELFKLDKKIRSKIIFNTKKYLVNLVNADVLYYYFYDKNTEKFIKKEGRDRDTAIKLSYFEKIIIDFNINYPLEVIEKIKTKDNKLMVNQYTYSNHFTEALFRSFEKRIIAFPIFINKEPFSLLYLEKINTEFSDEDKTLINTIVKQIQGVLQMAHFKRKSFEIMRNLSHQVISPLAGLETYTSQLIRNTLDVSDIDYYPIDDNKRLFIYNLLQSQTQHVINLTTGNRYFIAIESGYEPVLNLKTFNLTLALIEIVSVFQPIAKMSGINSIQVIENENIFVHSDKTLLSHIGYCLVDNAIKYSDKYKDITIRLSEIERVIDKEKRKIIKVQFIDFGLIIPLHLNERIFDKDYRSPYAIKRNPHGSGIGLYLVKRFAKLLGGRCYVEESSVRNGTIMTLEISKTLKYKNYDSIYR